jgi:hypothetical protein
VKTESKIKDFVERLITEGDAVLATQFKSNKHPYPLFVNLELFEQWRSRCRLLVSMLGSIAEPWRLTIGKESNNLLTHAMSTQGAVKGIKQSLDEGLLIRFEDIVLAEAFSDLFEQADYLFSKGYFLASGVIARAILEERLRRMCVANNCVPQKERPTLGDFNTELYKNNSYDKITFKHVDALAAIGNDAAHNDPGLKKEDVRRLLDDLQSFLQRYAA